MFRRILIPLDGSETAEAVLPTIERMLLREDAVAVLFRAIHCPDAIVLPHYPTMKSDLEQSALTYLALIASGLRDKGLIVETRVIHGEPGESILIAAEEEECDLIALSTHGRRGFTRFLLGSVAEKVIRHTPRPVLAVRAFGGTAAPAPPRPFKNILLPLDGSSESEKILPAAVDLCRIYGSKLVILRVVEPLPRPAPMAPIVEAASGQLEELTARLRAEGVDVLAFLRTGEPADEILKFAAENTPDLIAMTTHGRRGMARWVMGSVAERVLRHALSPVFLLRLYGASWWKRSTSATSAAAP